MLLGAICILLVCFVASLGRFLLFNEFGVYLSKKKKKKLYNVLKNIDEKEVIISSMMMLVLHVAILWLLVFHLVKSEGISMVFLFHISLMTFLCFYAYSKLNK